MAATVAKVIFIPFGQVAMPRNCVLVKLVMFLQQSSSATCHEKCFFIPDGNITLLHADTI